MPVFDIFSKRKARAEKDAPDVLLYDTIPNKLKHQIVMIIRLAMGAENRSNATHRMYKTIWDRLQMEYGDLGLNKADSNYPEDKLEHFILRATTVEDVLNATEIALVTRGEGTGSFPGDYFMPELSIDQTIDEINTRFLENAVGYRYESGQFIRIDTEFTHAEIVKPALRLLQDPHYQHANDEFLSAHEHYRHGRHEECLTDCLKAFETTMKLICSRRGWGCSNDYNAHKLINLCLEKGLFPSHLLSQFTALRTILESGAPTIRNKTGAHGKGTEARNVPQYMASYMIQTTAAAITLFVEADKALA